MTLVEFNFEKNYKFINNSEFKFEIFIPLNANEPYYQVFDSSV